MAAALRLQGLRIGQQGEKFQPGTMMDGKTGKPMTMDGLLAMQKQMQSDLSAVGVGKVAPMTDQQIQEELRKRKQQQQTNQAIASGRNPSTARRIQPYTFGEQLAQDRADEQMIADIKREHAEKYGNSGSAFNALRNVGMGGRGGGGRGGGYRKRRTTYKDGGTGKLDVGGADHDAKQRELDRKDAWAAKGVQASKAAQAEADRVANFPNKKAIVGGR